MVSGNGPLTPDEIRAVQESPEDIRAGRMYSHDGVKRELGDRINALYPPLYCHESSETLRLSPGRDRERITRSPESLTTGGTVLVHSRWMVFRSGLSGLANTRSSLLSSGEPLLSELVTGGISTIGFEEIFPWPE